MKSTYQKTNNNIILNNAKQSQVFMSHRYWMGGIIWSLWNARDYIDHRCLLSCICMSFGGVRSRNLWAEGPTSLHDERISSWCVSTVEPLITDSPNSRNLSIADTFLRSDIVPQESVLSLPSHNKNLCIPYNEHYINEIASNKISMVENML